MYRLTEEGEKYLEEGLPEKRLMQSLDGTKEISEVKERIEGSSLAINWALKNGWIEIKEGTIHVKKRPKEIRLQKALEKVKQGEGLDENTKEKLIDRSLIEEVREDIVKQAKEQLEKGSTSNLTPELIKTGLWREADFKEYDPTKTGKRKYPGRKHILSYYIQDIRRVFFDMGFEEMKGPYVESSFWNMDALFIPQDHPARDMQDTFYMKKPEETKLPDKELIGSVKKMHEQGNSRSEGWNYSWKEEMAKRPVLRTHTTAVSARKLAEIEPPAKLFSVDKVFRNETLDYSHLPEFMQVEGIVASGEVNFQNLLGYLEEFYKKLGFKKIRFRPGYFPYTEMSVEPEVYFEEKDEWLEMGGAGIFREEVTEPLGIEVPVLAWGLGLERLPMIREGIDDIRNFYYENNLKMLKGAKI
ncbi:MAG: phenylalanine--tRNA ligase subunit alpha [Candidatus Aenigmatarchaeota archaeon]